MKPNTRTSRSWSAFAVAGLAPLVLAGAWPLRHRSGYIRHPARLVLVLVPLIVALLIAQQAGPLGLGAPPEEDW